MGKHKHIAMASVRLSGVNGIPGGYVTTHAQTLHWRYDVSEEEMRGIAFTEAQKAKPGLAVDEILVMMAPVM